MLDRAIDEFFAQRKEAWLKKNIKPSLDEVSQSEKQSECERIFSLEKWLPYAAERAGQISLATHPCTYSHPSARKNSNGYATPVTADASREIDGYLRSGNINVETDALGNAAALDVYKFLTLVMEDGRKLIDHIQEDSELAVSLLDVQPEAYQMLKDGFLSMIKPNKEAITSSKIKQVYFPVADSYHLFSLLTPSGIVYELKKRVDNLRFSEEVKTSREQRRNNNGSLWIPGSYATNS